MAIAALLSLTSTASAEPPASASAQHAEPPPAKPRVSTSPETLPGAPNRTRTRPDRRASAAEDQPPLTRAAERARIDRMSPSRWLAHFGDVSIERRD
ncbi:MAG: hypothetical protein R3F35_05290 [Myxococcota bacterium]